ncbi:MAG: hypothetical protein ACK5LM_06100, partial [Lactovum sp.]
MSHLDKQVQINKQTSTNLESPSNFVNIFTLSRHKDLISKLKDLSAMNNSQEEIFLSLDKVQIISEKLDQIIQENKDCQEHIDNIQLTFSQISQEILKFKQEKEILEQEITNIQLGDFSSLEYSSTSLSEKTIQTFINFKKNKQLQIDSSILLLERKYSYENKRLKLAEKNYENSLIKFQRLDNSAQKILTNLKKIKLVLEKEALRRKIKNQKSLDKSLETESISENFSLSDSNWQDEKENNSNSLLAEDNLFSDHILE